MNLPEIAVFGLERTITDRVLHNALGDIALLGLGDPDVERGFKAFRNSEQRTAMYNWMSDRDEGDVEQLLDQTAHMTPERIAPWAKLVIGAEYEAGRQICLYSSTLPQELVEAYADGVETLIPGVEIEWIFGKPTFKENGKYTGKTGGMLKANIMESLNAKGHDIDLVADSFYTALPAMHKGRRILFVNPDQSLIESESFKNSTSLYWRRDDPQTTRLRMPDDAWDRIYDLGDEEDRGMLLADLGY